MKFSAYTVQPTDIDSLEAKDCYSLGEMGCSKMLADLSYSNPDSLCVSFGIDGRILGVAGSFRQWAGSSQLWAIFDKEVDKYPMALTRICNSLILYAVKKQNLRRVSINVKSDYTKGNRFAWTLGFDFEGKMHGFLPDGTDANLYARLF